MKKILSKFEKHERTDNSNTGSHQREATSFIGKVFTVGKAKWKYILTKHFEYLRYITRMFENN